MKVSKKSLLYFLMLVPFLEPAFISTTRIEPILSLLRKGLFFVSILLVFYYWNSGRIKQGRKFIAAVYAYFGVLLISSAISPTGSLNQWWYLVLIDISICNIVCIWLSFNYRSCIKYLLAYVEVLLAINLFTLIYFPNGLFERGVYAQYFLGYDNTHIRWIAPALLLSLVWSFIQEKDGKWKRNFIGIHPRTLVLYGISVAHVVISKSATSVVAIVIITILIVLLNKRDNDRSRKKRWIFAMKVPYLIAIVGTLIVVLMTNSYLGSLLIQLQTLFKKNIEINRIIIWRNVLTSIANNPILGVGVEKGITTSMKLFGSETQGASAHNYLLNVLYQCGVIGGLLFANIYRLIGKKVDQFKGSLPSAYICIYFICVAVMGIMEPQHSAVYMYVVWCVSYYIDLVALQND